MPLIEHTDVKVTLIVEADGHRLTFEETARARGARYHGKDPRKHGYTTDSTLEDAIRSGVNLAVAKAHCRATLLLQRAYPLSTDRVPS